MVVGHLFLNYLECLLNFPEPKIQSLQRWSLEICINIVHTKVWEPLTYVMIFVFEFSNIQLENSFKFLQIFLVLFIIFAFSRKGRLLLPCLNLLSFICLFVFTSSCCFNKNCTFAIFMSSYAISPAHFPALISPRINFDSQMKLAILDLTDLHPAVQPIPPNRY